MPRPQAPFWAALALLLLALCGAAATRPVADDPEGWRKPWFCHGCDCPPFKMVGGKGVWELGFWAQRRRLASPARSSSYLLLRPHPHAAPLRSFIPCSRAGP